MADYVTLTDKNFEAEVLQSEVPVLVDFWAAWCGPCRLMNPIVESLATEYAGIAKVAKLNVDDFDALATQYQVMAIPSLLFFQNGQVFERIEGVVPKEALEGTFQLLLSAA